MEFSSRVLSKMGGDSGKQLVSRFASKCFQFCFYEPATFCSDKPRTKSAPRNQCWKNLSILEVETSP